MLAATAKVESTVSPVGEAKTHMQQASLMQHLQKRFKDLNHEFQPWKTQFTPPGWFGEEEKKFLYVMGRWCPGPLLEQGPFAGLSTTAYASGVRDSHLLDKKPKKVLLTCDIFPAIEDDQTHYPYVFRLPSNTSSGGESDATQFHLVLEGSTVDSFVLHNSDWKTFGEVLSHPGGAHAYLVTQLSRNHLLDYVSVVTGRTYPNLDYRCAFFDTAHSGLEILHALPAWVQTVKQRGGKQQVLAFHDHFGYVNLKLQREDGVVKEMAYIGCKGVVTNIWNIVSSTTFGWTWVVHVQDLRPAWQQAVRQLPDPHALGVLVRKHASYVLRHHLSNSVCTTLCHKIHSILGEMADTRFPCVPSGDPNDAPSAHTLKLINDVRNQSRAYIHSILEASGGDAHEYSYE